MMMMMRTIQESLLTQLGVVNTRSQIRQMHVNIVTSELQYTYIYIYIYCLSEWNVRQRPRRPGFNPISSHTKNLIDGT